MEKNGGSDPESVYVSRKLIIRQMQKQIAKDVHEERTNVSEYDSWSDLEENFALAYEPIPLSIKLDSWRKMTKGEIIRKVNSKKIRIDFEQLNHSEIIERISEMQRNARYLSNKFGIHDLQIENYKAEIRDKLEPRESENIVSGELKKDSHKTHDSWSSRQSSILKDPEGVYVSRQELLDRIKMDITQSEVLIKIKEGLKCL